MRAAADSDRDDFIRLLLRAISRGVPAAQFQMRHGKTNAIHAL
jgi:hypothetical protein